MAIEDAEGGATEEPAIRLLIDSSDPIPLDTLAKLLRSLAQDYKTITRGRRLVVAQLTQGSIIAILKDAVLGSIRYLKSAGEALKVAKGAADLIKAIKGALAERR